jgi:hypothetical protein
LPDQRGDLRHDGVGGVAQRSRRDLRAALTHAAFGKDAFYPERTVVYPERTVVSLPSPAWPGRQARNRTESFGAHGGPLMLADGDPASLASALRGRLVVVAS